MSKANNGPRSKFSVLPHQARWRAYNLILDGATLRALLSDPELGNALKLAGITLNAPNLTRIKQSKEFAEFAKMRREHLMGRERDLMLTAIAQDTGTADSMSDQVKVKLLAVLDELTDLPDLADEDKVKAVRSLAQSLTQLSNTAKDNRIAELKRKLDDQQDRFEAAEKEWQAREAELLARIAELEGSRQAAKGMTPETLKQVEEKIKLM
mgnify:FL=1